MNPVEMLENGAALVLSVSGGKDSDAMSHELLDRRKREGWTGEVRMIHADLGKAEWKETPAYVENLAERCGVPLHVTRHSYGDLIDGIRRRMDTLRAEGRLDTTPPFPSSAARYCTSDWKRAPISRWIRNQYPTGNVVCAMGLRAEESSARAKKPVFEVRDDCCSKSRTVLNWNPILDWIVEEVWYTIDTLGNGIKHPAYGFGNERLSCALCVLASQNDILNGAIHQPDTYEQLVILELESGWAFRQGFWLMDLKPELLSLEVQHQVHEYRKVRRDT